MLVFQAAINIGVIAGVLPFTGITLPFVSSGGSSLLVSMLAIGVLLSVSRYSREPAPSVRTVR
jgi:cell division protein FtsW